MHRGFEVVERDQGEMAVAVDVLQGESVAALTSWPPARLRRGLGRCGPGVRRQLVDSGPRTRPATAAVGSSGGTMMRSPSASRVPAEAPRTIERAIKVNRDSAIAAQDAHIAQRSGLLDSAREQDGVHHEDSPGDQSHAGHHHFP